MFSKILIANRGEIAVRIERTCREMGIRTVAVFSTADANALHVQRADEAHWIGQSPVRDSYLNKAAILEAAVQSGAEAIHPGYGFLAENSDFARDVLDAGLVWVGPEPGVIALLGDKAVSRQAAQAAGVPVVPGYHDEDQSIGCLVEAAERIGYPVMIKASAGGGGRGMRSVYSADQLLASIESAVREAETAFGDGRVFLEKLLINPRHVEVQVLADSTGSVVWLGERDCSIQRRHQKVIEESPSPALPESVRSAMGSDAVRLARHTGYVSAGTVEFLFSGERHFFLEVNTRIQVEHPVTEMVTGIDLIREQLRIAAGESLNMTQEDVHLNGHAIEARLYAEDPSHGFLPSTGTITEFSAPLGDGIRNDVGVYSGSPVSSYYDPLLAKIIIHANTRGAAIDSLLDALDIYRVHGVTTNLHFLRWIVDQPGFRDAEIDTGFLDRLWNPGDPGQTNTPIEVLCAAAAWDVAAVPAGRNPDLLDPWLDRSSWRHTGIERIIVFECQSRRHEIGVTVLPGGVLRLRFGESERTMSYALGEPGTIVLREGSRVLQLAVKDTDAVRIIAWRGSEYRLRAVSLLQVGRILAGADGTSADLSSPMPGTVARVDVTSGEQVKAGQPLMVLEAMKMEHIITAPCDGTVRAICYQKGDMVAAGSPLLELEPF